MWSETNVVPDELIPTGSTSLCCFATHGKEDTNSVPPNTALLIVELCKFYDIVVVLTNRDVTYFTDSVVRDVLRDDKCRICQVPNACLDFGMYWRFLLPLSSPHRSHSVNAATIRRIALVNDSCLLVQSLEGLMTWAGKHELSYWGVTKSFKPTVHIQSYFLEFCGTSAQDALFEFVRKNDIRPFATKTKWELIVAYELGLSKHMNKKGFPLAARYNTTSLLMRRRGHDSGALTGHNPSHFLWDRLVTMGCPLIKKRRHYFVGDHDFITSNACPAFVESLD